MNNKKLLLLFLILLGIYGLSRFFSTKKIKSFKTELIQVDTASVTSIVIIPKSPDQKEISLKREHMGWIVSNGIHSTKATQNALNSILGNLTLIKTKRIAAKSPEKWAEYEVEEGNGTRVRVYKDQKMLEDFIVGRFSFNQQTRSGTSFVRLYGEDEVYAVDGFLTMTFGQAFDSYRNKQIIKMKSEMEVNEFSYQQPDTSLQFLKFDGQWALNGNMRLDSTKVEAYLNSLKNISGTTFADDFDDVQGANLLFKTLTLEGNNILEPFVVTCYRDSSRARPFVIHSSQFPEAYFDSDSSGVYQRLFRDLSEFLSD